MKRKNFPRRKEQRKQDALERQEKYNNLSLAERRAHWIRHLEESRKNYIREALI